MCEAASASEGLQFADSRFGFRSTSRRLKCGEKKREVGGSMLAMVIGAFVALYFATLSRAHLTAETQDLLKASRRRGNSRLLRATTLTNGARAR
jgi:hypothetical protein